MSKPTGSGRNKSKEMLRSRRPDKTNDGPQEGHHEALGHQRRDFSGGTGQTGPDGQLSDEDWYIHTDVYCTHCYVVR